MDDMTDAELLRALLALEAEAHRRNLIDKKSAPTWRASSIGRKH